MGGEFTLKAAIAEVLATSDKKGGLVVYPWPDIVQAFRDTFNVRAHGIMQDDTLIAAAMGHTVEVHHRSYRTSEWRSVRKAFAQAS